jgi:hypothetical protein
VVGRLSRADAADLVAVPESGPDVVALREEAAARARILGSWCQSPNWRSSRTCG